MRTRLKLETGLMTWKGKQPCKEEVSSLRHTSQKTESYPSITQHQEV